MFVARYQLHIILLFPLLITSYTWSMSGHCYDSSAVALLCTLAKVINLRFYSRLVASNPQLIC